MNRTQLSRLLLIITILYVVGFYFIGSALKPGYSQLSNFVSEYNATGTPWSGTLTYTGFVAIAVLFSCFLITVRPVAKVAGISRLGFWFLWSVPASYILAAIVPCDPGCPVEGSTSQFLHNVSGVVVYFGMGIGVALVSLAPGFNALILRRSFMLLTGFAFPVVFILMLQPDLAPWRGLMQRTLDVALATSLILLTWTIIAPDRRASHGGS